MKSSWDEENVFGVQCEPHIIKHVWVRRVASAVFVEVYDVVECGRRVRRSLAFSTAVHLSMHDELRASFTAGFSRPISVRRRNLLALRRLFTENEEAILDALKQDLGRTRFEATLYDYLIPLSEIDHLLKNLEKWTAPRQVGFSLLTWPSSNYIYPEPRGVCLVIGVRFA